MVRFVSPSQFRTEPDEDPTLRLLNPTAEATLHNSESTSPSATPPRPFKPLDRVASRPPPALATPEVPSGLESSRSEPALATVDLGDTVFTTEGSGNRVRPLSSPEILLPSGSRGTGLRARVAQLMQRTAGGRGVGFPQLQPFQGLGRPGSRHLVQQRVEHAHQTARATPPPSQPAAGYPFAGVWRGARAGANKSDPQRRRAPVAAPGSAAGGGASHKHAGRFVKLPSPTLSAAAPPQQQSDPQKAARNGGARRPSGQPGTSDRSGRLKANGAASSGSTNENGANGSGEWRRRWPRPPNPLQAVARTASAGVRGAARIATLPLRSEGLPPTWRTPGHKCCCV